MVGRQEPTVKSIGWTDYLKYRAKLRVFELDKIEHILRYSVERYVDAATGRTVAIGRHDQLLIVIPYDEDENTITPITVHTTTRQQIRFRIKTGRYVHESSSDELF
jgi:hypothetical protein